MALRAKKKSNTSGTFDAIDTTDTLEKEDVTENSLEVEKEPEEVSVKPEDEETAGENTNKITKRRQIKGVVNNLSLRLNAEDLMAVKFLSLKRKKSIQLLLVEGLNLLIKEELKHNPEDNKYLHVVK